MPSSIEYCKTNLMKWVITVLYCLSTVTHFLSLAFSPDAYCRLISFMVAEKRTKVIQSLWAVKKRVDASFEFEYRWKFSKISSTRDEDKRKSFCLYHRRTYTFIITIEHSCQSRWKEKNKNLYDLGI